MTKTLVQSIRLKYIFIGLAFTVTSYSRAQSIKIKPYLAIVITNTDKFKGILHQADSSRIILNDNGNFITVKTATVKQVMVREVKKKQQFINLIKTGTEPQEYHVDSRGKAVDKWGHELPTPDEELAATFYSVFATAIVNGLALPVHAINPSIAKYRFNENSEDNRNKINELNFYSIYYQANPNVLAELSKIKELSGQFKP